MGSDKGKNEGLGGLAAGAHGCGCGDALAGRILHLHQKIYILIKRNFNEKITIRSAIE